MAFGKRGVPVAEPRPMARTSSRAAYPTGAVPISASPSAPTAATVAPDYLESREEGRGWLRKLGTVLAVIAATVAGLFVLGLYSPGAAAAAFFLLVLLLIIATPVLGWLLLLWLCRWAGRFLAGGDKALASMIGTGLFVTLLIGGLLTSCMLQGRIADGLSRAMMKAAETNADTQERFSKQFEQDMDRAMRRWRD